jgi:meso-butanediol dehydrogenase / (S,S)-butanediol dehydrogenase / diacetyl reductase
MGITAHVLILPGSMNLSLFGWCGIFPSPRNRTEVFRGRYLLSIYPWLSTLVCRMVRTMARLNGKVAAVTGGASGIGEATVRRFVMEGAKVAFADRDVERGKRVAAEIAASGGEVVFVEAHVEREVEAAAFVRQAARRFGRLNILVNNAGVRLYHTVEEASAESWDEILGVNLKGYAFCAKAAIPLLRQASSGSIVNVASVRSVTSIGKTTQYDTTKAAVGGLTRGMAADHAADGIRVNAVCPGPIYTPFHEKRNQALGRTFEQYRDDAAKGTLLRRHGTPDEVAACILFLASDDASYVTGTLLFVDGGYTAM